MPIDLSSAALASYLQQVAAASPNAPAVPPQPRKRLLDDVGLPMLIGGVGLDTGSTLADLHNPSMHESDPLVGGLAKHPAAFVATQAGETAGLGYLLNKLADTHPTLAGVLATAIGGERAAAGAHNLLLRRRAP